MKAVAVGIVPTDDAVASNPADIGGQGLAAARTANRNGVAIDAVAEHRAIRDVPARPGAEADAGGGRRHAQS